MMNIAETESLSSSSPNNHHRQHQHQHHSISSSLSSSIGYPPHHHHDKCNIPESLFAQHMRVLKNIFNQKTCSVSALSSLTGLDAQSVHTSLAYWKSLGFVLRASSDNTLPRSTAAEGEEHHDYSSSSIDAVHSSVTPPHDPLQCECSNSNTNAQQQLPMKFICTLCKQRSTDFICIPCGHFCLCSQCKPKVYRQCPICWRQCSVIKVV